MILGVTYFSVVACLISQLSKANPQPQNGATMQRHSKEPFRKDEDTPVKDARFDVMSKRLDKLEFLMQESLANFTLIESSLLANISNQNRLIESRLNNLSMKVEDVEESLNADVNYWNSSSDCGGTIISQTGKISYTKPAFRIIASTEDWYGTCIWTIRCNLRSKIEVQLSSGNLVAVVEFASKNDGSHLTNLTRLVLGRNYVFRGPVILIISSPNGGVSLTFQGHGKVVQEETLFRHENFMVNDSIIDLGVTGNDHVSRSNGFQQIFTTVVFTTHSSSLIEWNATFPNTCGNGLISVITADELENENGNIQQARPCCTGEKCSLYILDGWFIAIYSDQMSDIGKDVKLQWSSSGRISNSVNGCGGILTGRRGRISYKRYAGYDNNERCIWILYPFPKNSIKIKSYDSRLEPTHDHVTVLEIDKSDVASTVLANPVINKTYMGRVILITFFTDNSIVRSGFQLNWEAVGPSDLGRSLNTEHIFHHHYLEEANNTNDFVLGKDGLRLFVITNENMGGSFLEMHVSRSPGSHCQGPSGRIAVLGTRNGHIDNHTTTRLCGNSTLHAPSEDGIGIVFIAGQLPESDVKMPMQISWELSTPEDDGVIAPPGDQCGGVIHLGVRPRRLSYKLETYYAAWERCIWLVHSPNSKAIKITLLKDEFEACCDYLLVDTIDPSSATINNSTIMISRHKRTGIISGNFFILTFRSDGSTPGRGFLVEFETIDSQTNAFQLRLDHRTDLFGSFRYRVQSENAGWGDDNNSNGDILVLAVSTPVDGEEYILFNVTIEDMVLGIDAACQSDILNFYKSTTRDGFTLAESYPSVTCSECRNCSKNTLAQNDYYASFTTTFRAFVGIYKPVKAPVERNQSFHISWESSTACGDVHYDDNGEIVYKLNTQYKNNEQCIWTINLRRAKKIRFLLTRSGMESCCDKIILASFKPTANQTILGYPATLGPYVQAIMDGPVVFVAFRSDSSVTGEGFKLTYSAIDDHNVSNNQTGIEESEEILPEYKFHHFLLQRRNFSFEYPLRGRPALGPHDILTFSFSPAVSIRDTYMRYGTNIRITSLNLGLNRESCAADALMFYDLRYEDFHHVKTFKRETLECPGSSEHSEDFNVTCTGCDSAELEIMENKEMTVKTTYPAFLGIYVSATPSTLRQEGTMLKIEWTDSFPPSQTPTTSTSRPRII